LDHFLDENVIDSTRRKLYEKYPDLSGRKVVLFAPTYRGYSQDDAYYDYDEVDFERLHEFAKNSDAMVVIKMHHFITKPAPVPKKFSDRIIELSGENINELFYIADVLITDYSSCFYDFSLLGKPMLFFAYDKDVYSSTRGVHRRLEEVAPGKICEDFESLITALENEDYEYPEREDVFVDRAIEKNGLNSDIVIDTVLGIGKV
jgi:CDP-ribitol ribitolphosphotransferase